jgi:hypothetical protein
MVLGTLIHVATSVRAYLVELGTAIEFYTIRHQPTAFCSVCSLSHGGSHDLSIAKSSQSSKARPVKVYINFLQLAFGSSDRRRKGRTVVASVQPSDSSSFRGCLREDREPWRGVALGE